MADWRSIVISKAGTMATRRNGGVLLAASAVAAATWLEYEHRHVASADVPEAHIRIERLSDLRFELETLAAIDAGLRTEWGPFAFLGFAGVEEMAALAGETIYVAREMLDGRHTPRAVVQTIRLDIQGDAERLRETYATFGALTSREAWHESHARGGDTAVLLQITVLGRDERGGGLGSLLRNTALHMLPDEVRFALTTTPLDGASGPPVQLDDPQTFTPAMRFHFRGGAQPALLLSGFKTDPSGAAQTHAGDIVVMRYARGDDGAWPAPRPAMRLHSAGPLEERFRNTTRRLRAFPLARGRQLLAFRRRSA